MLSFSSRHRCFWLGFTGTLLRFFKFRVVSKLTKLRRWEFALTFWFDWAIITRQITFKFAHVRHLIRAPWKQCLKITAPPDSLPSGPLLYNVCPYFSVSFLWCEYPTSFWFPSWLSIIITRINYKIDCQCAFLPAITVTGFCWCVCSSLASIHYGLSLTRHCGPLNLNMPEGRRFYCIGLRNNQPHDPHVEYSNCEYGSFAQLCHRLAVWHFKKFIVLPLAVISIGQFLFLIYGIRSPSKNWFVNNVAD